jgi:hypothetical protein
MCSEDLDVVHISFKRKLLRAVPKLHQKNIQLRIRGYDIQFYKNEKSGQGRQDLDADMDMNLL